MALPTPKPVTPQPVTPKPVTPQPVTPKPVTPKPVTPQPAEQLGSDAVMEQTLDAQPTPNTPAQGAGVNSFAARHYQTSRGDVKDTNLTLPNGVKFYGHLGVCKVDLTGLNSTTVKLTIDGAYRTVSDGDKIICSRDDLVNLLRKPYIKELPDSTITLSA